MNRLEKEHIDSNLADLIKNTDCNDAVLAGLSKHLSESDFESLGAKKLLGGKISQAKEFYNIMTKKANSYDDLIDVLVNEKQIGPADILKQIRKDTNQGSGTGKPDPCESLIVGKDPCTFVAVKDVMRGSGSRLWKKLLDLAKTLGIPEEDYHSIGNRLNRDTVTSTGALLEILESWRSKTSNNATLGNLIKALKDNELVGCADDLRQHFSGNL